MASHQFKLGEFDVRFGEFRTRIGEIDVKIGEFDARIGEKEPQVGEKCLPWEIEILLCPVFSILLKISSPDCRIILPATLLLCRQSLVVEEPFGSPKWLTSWRISAIPSVLAKR
jgi:hypothetical protein